MATYAIGDVQGCHEQLLALLDRLRFDPGRDRLRFAGDLVNRGPRSLDVLRFVRGLGEAAESVLGNHDLHLLAAAHGLRPAGKSDTFEEVLAAPDRDELLDWLRGRPMLDERPDTGYVLVHAGLPPQWDLGTARACARELESMLRGKRIASFLSKMYGNEPRRWSDSLAGADRLRYITNAFTRLRYCEADGAMDFSESGPPGTQRAGLVPWFEAPGRRNRGVPILFGHWASLGADREASTPAGVVSLDTGCVWGGALTAVREEDGARFAVPGWNDDRR